MPKKKNEKVEENIFTEHKFKPKRYIGFNTRFIVSLIIFIVLLTTSIILILMSLSKINEQTIEYKESSGVNYEVLLKDDSQYDEKYFKDDSRSKIYISSLIKDIDTDFDYNFSINEESNIEFNYNVVAKLVILNSDSTKVFYDSETDLIGSKTLNIGTEKNIKIHEDILIDYEYYNSIANTFRQNYGLSTTSYLEVIMTIYGKTLDNKFDFNEKYTRSIRIPLSQQEVDIQSDNSNGYIHKLIVKNKLLVSNRLCIIIGIISLIVAIICFIKIINIILKVYTPKMSKYDKFIKKIMKEYDRLIVNTTTAPNIEEFNVVRINNFAELLDVHDNLNLPIRYYVINEHHKSIFYVAHNSEVYVYIVKAVDLEK